MSSLREAAIVLFKRDCSQHIPSQATAHDNREQLCLVIGCGRCGFIWCEFLAVRATPYTASCGQASTIAGERRRIQGRTRVGPHGRDLKLPSSNSDRATGPHRVHPVSLLFLRCSSCVILPAATMPLTWAEDRASAEKQPQRRPRGQHPRGRHDAALCYWGLAPKR